MVSKHGAKVRKMKNTNGSIDFGNRRLDLQIRYSLSIFPIQRFITAIEAHMLIRLAPIQRNKAPLKPIHEKQETKVSANG